MLKKDKVDFIIQKLDEIYPDVSPPLKHSDIYTLLIAVLLSANTTDKILASQGTLQKLP